jgi:hypothetical protein
MFVTASLAVSSLCCSMSLYKNHRHMSPCTRFWQASIGQTRRPTACRYADCLTLILECPDGNTQCASRPRSSARTSVDVALLDPDSRIPPALDAQCHDRVDYIVVVLFERLDSFLARNAGLCHDKFNVLVLNAVRVYLFVIFLFLLGLALVAVTSVVVAGMVVLGRLVGELLGSGGLGAGVQVLDLSLTKDTAQMSVHMLLHGGIGGTELNSHVGVAIGGLVDLGVVDDEEDLEAR